MTYLKTLHPYPAMIADELAASLAQRFINPGALVLDPFCGTGRTLMAAAERGGKCLGVDVNPLAVMIANAKAGAARPAVLDHLICDLSRKRLPSKALLLDLEPGRLVDWFSNDARCELSQIIDWINQQRLDRAELLLVAAVLSATARDVSLCRKKQWKLHRMDAAKRKTYRRSAWKVFVRKLSAVAQELIQKRPFTMGKVEALQGDARDLPSILPPCWKGQLDVVFTSPPYGDSRTTVGYGGVSGICLGVVRNIRGMENIFLTGGEIDYRCLGGGTLASHQIDFDLSCFWKGDAASSAAKRVTKFLIDVYDSCGAVVDSLKDNGWAIFVVSRRRVDGEILYLDYFLTEVLGRCGVALVEQSLRCVDGKRTPLWVDSKARTRRTRDENNSFTPTITEEIVQVFRKRPA